MTWTPAGSDQDYRYSAAALSVFWPENEHAKLIERWPFLAAAVADNWDEHRRQAERNCASIERAGYAVNQFAGNFGDLEDSLKDRNVTTPSAADLAAYPDVSFAADAMTAWPPDRTAACWCGSGRKYKQCCRRHGLGTL